MGFRMMSDRPLNPINTPDPWEAVALDGFLSGETDGVGELSRDRGDPAYRYVALLLVEPPCLSCHEKQGYSVGQVRGALSVSIPAQPVLRAEALQLWRLLGGYGALWILGLVGITLSSRLLLRVEEARDRVIDELQAALHEVKTLHGLLPIFAKCKKVRNDEGYWEQIESYIGQRSGAKFTHGICPICSEELYGDAVLEVLNRPTKEDDNQG